MYVENLQAAQPHVEELLSAFQGRTIVTSDHGNAFGEWDVYGHPARTYISPLLDVPWLVQESGERKDIAEGETSTESYREDDSVTERLRSLGYLDDE